jgi:flavin-dependent dehydrogenase
VSFDPLSSQGLFNALYTGLAAAEAADRHLSGATEALTDYERAIADIWSAYRAQLALWYRAEGRWADRPFWRRRLAAQ